MLSSLCHRVLSDAESFIVFFLKMTLEAAFILNTFSFSAPSMSLWFCLLLLLTCADLALLFSFVSASMFWVID